MAFHFKPDEVYIRYTSFGLNEINLRWFTSGRASASTGSVDTLAWPEVKHIIVGGHHI